MTKSTSGRASIAGRTPGEGGARRTQMPRRRVQPSGELPGGLTVLLQGGGPVVGLLPAAVQGEAVVVVGDAQLREARPDGGPGQLGQGVVRVGERREWVW